jgi:hypothetical protein
VIDPRGMRLTDWADSVTLAIRDVWSVQRLDDEARWQDWATSLVRAAQVTAQDAPNPYLFSDWRDWAERAYPMLESLAR